MIKYFMAWQVLVSSVGNLVSTRMIATLQGIQLNSDFGRLLSFDKVLAMDGGAWMAANESTGTGLLYQ